MPITHSASRLSERGIKSSSLAESTEPLDLGKLFFVASAYDMMVGVGGVGEAV